MRPETPTPPPPPTSPRRHVRAEREVAPQQQPPSSLGETGPTGPLPGPLPGPGG